MTREAAFGIGQPPQKGISDEQWDRYITNAPKMHKALVELLKHFKPEHEKWAAVVTARAVVAKVEGRS